MVILMLVSVSSHLIFIPSYVSLLIMNYNYLKIKLLFKGELMKKIGILTFHRAENYGAVLQTYALQEYISKMSSNYEVEVIDYRSPFIEKYYKLLSFKSIY